MAWELSISTLLLYCEHRERADYFVGDELPRSKPEELTPIAIG